MVSEIISSSEWRALFDAETHAPASERAAHVARSIVARHGDATAAVLFYGSGLRTPDDPGKMLDFYVLATNYKAFHRNLAMRAANAVLPPNVYYFEDATIAPTARAKYAVYSLTDFERWSTPATRESVVWGRFAQPCRLIYAADEATRARVRRALANCAATLLGETAPLMEGAFAARDLWVRALDESYASELRAERAGRSADIYEANAARYERLARLFVDAGPPQLALKSVDEERFICGAGEGARRRARRAWRARRWLGKTKSAARLGKGVFTFEGGVDYILGKIEAHSGITVETRPWHRRFPLIAGPVLAWRLYRKGAFK